MTDILIKSFNRPYYLERCLASIEKNVTGNFNVIVLDDGTPEEYLIELQRRFPGVQWRLAPAYKAKTASIKKHIAGEEIYAALSPPIAFWKEQVAGATPYFLLMEEDAWITHELPLDHYVGAAQKYGIVTLKFFWNQNEAIIKGRKVWLTEQVEEIIPELPLRHPLLLKMLAENAYKLTSLLTRTKLMSHRFFDPYYALYTVASGLFAKDFWLYTWHNAAENKIQERRQLLNAVRWHRLHPEARYAKSANELIQTSYITSATPVLKHIPFDMMLLNHQLNQAWLTGELESMENFPKDFTVEYLKQFLSNQSQSCSLAGWDLWISAFRAMHAPAT